MLCVTERSLLLSFNIQKSINIRFIAVMKCDMASNVDPQSTVASRGAADC